MSHRQALFDTTYDNYVPQYGIYDMPFAYRKGDDTIDRSLQIEEALLRMKMLKVHPIAIEKLKTDNKVFVSNSDGLLCEADAQQRKMIKDFEREHDAVVYHCILSQSSLGLMFSMLFVSKYDDEWILENKNIENGCVFAMVENLDDPNCSDMGSIGVVSSSGLLIRTW